MLCDFRMKRRDKDFQHLSHISERPSEVSVDVHASERESVISPPRRSSVIRESGQGGRVSVISPPANKVGQELV